MNPDQLFYMHEGILAVAHCCKLTLLNGEVIGLTDRDSDITVEDTIYSSDPGMDVIIIHNGKNAGSVEIESVVKDDILEHGESSSSSYLLAKIEVFLVNYTNISAGYLHIFKGIVHKTAYRGNSLLIYARKEMAYELSEKVCSVFSPQCRAQFCDNKCKLNSAHFTSQGSVERVLDEYTSFEDIKLSTTSNYYTYGIVSFLTGRNQNLSLKVCSHVGNSLTLASPTSYPITEGTNYSIIAGCDKSFSTCRKKFHNTVNFRGEPHIPDINSIYVPLD